MNQACHIKTLFLSYGGPERGGDGWDQVQTRPKDRSTPGRGRFATRLLRKKSQSIILLRYYPT